MEADKKSELGCLVSPPASNITSHMSMYMYRGDGHDAYHLTNLVFRDEISCVVVGTVRSQLNGCVGNAEGRGCR